ncbi:MAG: lysostaphin resistance A-like protein [Acidimicrobiales bacterium]
MTATAPPPVAGPPGPTTDDGEPRGTPGARAVAPVAMAGGALAAGVVAGGCALLTLRPAVLGAVADPTVAVVVLFSALLAVGVGWPGVAGGAGDGPGAARTGHGRAPAPTVAAAVALGVAAFAVGRVLGGGRAPAPFAVRLVALNSLAAVAEEAFFRRLAYGVLSASGPAAAVAGTAVLFAVVHVTVYGAWVLPIDLAAGLVLGWQRWATGSWLAPAATHVVANLLVMV